MDNTRPLGTIPGRVPSLLQRFDGCAFHSRCAHATEACTAEPIPLSAGHTEHRVRCCIATQESTHA